MYINFLCKQKINEATHYDNVPPEIVKICVVELSGTLAELINQTFIYNKFI